MKVLFLYRYGILGGVCTQLYHRLRHIPSEMELDIHCGFKSDHGVQEMLNPYATLHFGLDGSNTGAFLEENAFDVIIIIDSEEYIKAYRGSNVDSSVILEVHTSIERNLSYLTNLREDDLKAFITVSDYMIGRVNHHRTSAVEDLDIHLFENVLDTSLFGPREAVGEGPPVVLWVGKIDDHKDWRSYMKMASRINKIAPDVEFWIIGGQTCPEQLAQEVFEMSEEVQILQRFRWFDRIENDNMPSLYSLVAARGGVNLVTSHGESFGMAVLESLLAGCPVISSDVGALSEITAAAPYFQLYELGDIDQGSQLCLDLLLDSEKRDFAVAQLASTRPTLVETYCSSLRSAKYWKLLESIKEES